MKPFNLFLIEGALVSDCLCAAASALMFVPAPLAPEPAGSSWRSVTQIGSILPSISEDQRETATRSPSAGTQRNVEHGEHNGRIRISTSFSPDALVVSVLISLSFSFDSI